MSYEERIRKRSERNLKNEEDGTPYFEKVIFTEHFDFFDRKWKEDMEKRTVEKLTPEQIGLFKSKTVLVSFDRENVNTETLKTMRAHFLMELHVSVDAGKENKYLWLNFVNGRLFKQYLNAGKYAGFTCEISLSGSESCLNIRKGKVVRTTDARLAELLKSGEISEHLIFEDENLSSRTIYRARK
jgi:hypothetical protein